MGMGQDRRWVKVGIIGIKKGIYKPNNTAVLMNIINMAKYVIRPMPVPLTMLLPYNRRLLPLVGVE